MLNLTSDNNIFICINNLAEIIVYSSVSQPFLVCSTIT